MAFEYETSSRTMSRLGNSQNLIYGLSTSKSELENLDAIFPSKLSGPATVSKLIRIAERGNMSVTDVETQPGTAEEVGEHIYSSMAIQFQLEGTSGSLSNFLTELESGIIPASRLDHLNIAEITRLDTSESHNSTGGEAEYMLKVGLIISVFARIEASN